MSTHFSADEIQRMACNKQILWIMGCYKRDTLCLFLIEAKTESQAHHKAGMILRKHQNLWYEALEPLSRGFDPYPEEKINDEKTSFTICTQNTYYR